MCFPWRTCPGNPFTPVLELRTTRGEDDFFGFGSDQGSHFFSTLKEGVLRDLTFLMNTRGITEVFLEERQHGLHHGGSHRSSRNVIQVDTLASHRCNLRIRLLIGRKGERPKRNLYFRVRYGVNENLQLKGRRRLSLRVGSGFSDHIPDDGLGNVPFFIEFRPLNHPLPVDIPQVFVAHQGHFGMVGQIQQIEKTAVFTFPMTYLGH